MKLINYLKIELIIIRKYLRIGFRVNKQLEKLSFEYYKNWHFDNAYLIIDFKFKNAIWFRIGKIKSFDFSKPIIVNLGNIKSDTINFEVFGFFQKQIYEIKLKKEAEINSQSFKTKIDNISTFELVQQKTKEQMPKIALNISDPTFVFEKISVTPQNIQLNYNTFKIQDYYEKPRLL